MPKFSFLLCIFFITVLFTFSTNGLTQALFWVSQPAVQLGQVLNADIGSAEISANGRYGSFVSRASNVVSGDENLNNDLFVKDFQTGNIVRVNTTSSGSESIDGFLYSFSRPSNDGRYVAFIATDRNFPNYNPTNPSAKQLYLKDLQTGLLTAENIDQNSQTIVVGGNFVNQIHLSSDGRYLSFTAETDVTIND